MRQGQLEFTCPTCGKTVLRSQRSAGPFFPFCSERCKLLDLGKWLDGKHRIEERFGPGRQSAADEKENS